MSSIPALNKTAVAASDRQLLLRDGGREIDAEPVEFFCGIGPPKT
jgi:hypothetical protein